MPSYFVTASLGSVNPNDTIIHDTLNPNPDTHLTDLTINLTENAAGTLTAKITPNHPAYNTIIEATTWITAWEKGVQTPIFRGLCTKVDAGIDGARQIVCEGDMTMLNQSIASAWSITGSPAQVVQRILDDHNAQVSSERQIQLGVIDDDLDPNGTITRSVAAYPRPSSWETLKTRTIDTSAGGYLTMTGSWPRYLNWTVSSGGLSAQEINFGDNLLEFRQTVDASTVFTACEPFGAVTGQDADGNDVRVIMTGDTPGSSLLYTDTDGNNHYGIVNQDAENVFGSRLTSAVFDDVTIANNLPAAASKHLATLAAKNITLDAGAIDKHLISDLASFKLGSMVQVSVPPIGIDTIMRVTGLTIKPNQPDAWRIQLGAKLRSLSSAIAALRPLPGQVTAIAESNAIIGAQVNNNANLIQQNFAELLSYIDQTPEQIISIISATYTTRSALQETMEQFASELSQTANGLELLISQAKSQTSSVAGDLADVYQQIQTLIRLTSEGVEVGKSNSPVKAVLTNDGLIIRVNDVETSFFTDQRALISTLRVLNVLELGGFRLSPSPGGGVVRNWVGVS